MFQCPMLLCCSNAWFHPHPWVCPALTRVLQSSCRSRSYRGFCTAKACAARGHGQRFVSCSAQGCLNRRRCHSAPWGGAKVSKDLGWLLPCCCCSGVTSHCSAVRSEWSLLLEEVSSCGNCSGMSPFVLRCQPQAWHQLVYASGRCDSTA